MKPPLNPMNHHISMRVLLEYQSIIGTCTNQPLERLPFSGLGSYRWYRCHQDCAQRHHGPCLAPAAGLAPDSVHGVEKREAGAAARNRRPGDGRELGGDGRLTLHMFHPLSGFPGMGWMDGSMDGFLIWQVDGWMDGWMDVWPLRVADVNHFLWYQPRIYVNPGWWIVVVPRNNSYWLLKWYPPK